MKPGEAGELSLESHGPLQPTTLNTGSTTPLSMTRQRQPSTLLAMDSEYVVEVEVDGFVVEGMVAVDGSRIDAKQAKAANKEKFKALRDPLVKLSDSLVRDDGTGILWFSWFPPIETDETGKPTPDGAATWMEAKGYTAHVLSVVVGAGLRRVEHRIVIRDPEGLPDADAVA